MFKLLILVSFFVNVFVDSIPLDKPVIKGYIVGGNNTDISQVPYQVAIYERALLACGAFIVSPTHLVTAGRCVYRAREANVMIRAGSSSVNQGGAVLKVKKIYKHPKFNFKLGDYDVAVIEMATPLQLNNKTMKAIKLAAKEPSAGSLVLVSGWGWINQNLEEPKTLHSVTFPVYDRTKCANIYKTYNVTITPRMMCAGAEGKAPLGKDDGGPLAYKGEVVGIVSFSIGCGKKDIPGVYTNIADPEITKFIKDIVKF